MRYDREYRPRGSRSLGRGEYGDAYRPFGRGWSEGFDGGTLRSRGSWNAGARGYEPRRFEEEGGEFEWGEGYVGGRGYGGTNYDLEHGYATGGRGFRSGPPRGAPLREGYTPFSSGASRGGYAWGEADYAEEYGPARYGYGPYYDRLRRRRRADDELRQEVEDTLFYDTWVDADAITVQVQDGVVTLTGVLPSFEELRYAVDDAWDVDGVRGVRSELQVTRAVAARPGARTASQTSGGPTDPETYAAGAPHMHGHPDAGTDPAEYGSGRQEEPRGTLRGGRAQGSEGGSGTRAGGATPTESTGSGNGGGRSRGGKGGSSPGERTASGSRASGKTGGSSGRTRSARGRTSSAEQGTAGKDSGAGDGSPEVDQG